VSTYDGSHPWRASGGHAGNDRGNCTAFLFDLENAGGAVAFSNAETKSLLLSLRLADLDMHMMDWFN
jgi:hypothetical protein